MTATLTPARKRAERQEAGALQRAEKARAVAIQKLATGLAAAAAISVAPWFRWASPKAHHAYGRRAALLGMIEYVGAFGADGARTGSELLEILDANFGAHKITADEFRACCDFLNAYAAYVDNHGAFAMTKQGGR